MKLPSGRLAITTKVIIPKLTSGCQDLIWAGGGSVSDNRLTRHYCSSHRPVLPVYSRGMPEAKRQSTIVGYIGILCLALYWAARFVPGVADTFPVSSFGKFLVVGIILAGAPLTIIAAIRGSRWWWVAVAASAITLWDLYTGFVMSLMTSS